MERNSALEESILLIGPMGTGKTTVGRLLSQRFHNMQRIKVDEHRWKFFDKYTDYSRETEKRIREEKAGRGICVHVKGTQF